MKYAGDIGDESMIYVFNLDSNVIKSVQEWGMMPLPQYADGILNDVDFVIDCAILPCTCVFV